ncbi:hypothetical protein [Pseudobacteriovorax antillogorgiicola]|uniref:Uncharacterized protein n=1 Tax=Pseudobacteriovorax antillogorgiicola TaxID=1513793 RepID=A0A1Y6CNZ5_9BACT|nr:hypothetical protein [Pseudobacteriovorax antillogorgiicola]TCS44630.1 hypothetical protein EDD56_13263 [Pseudobacteriovorax antillogorgiicola]SMF78447.1 hypothetical protein SAMN06296036_13263 [Pseudobacteriovorax antillogorgiicola]
MEIYLDQNVLSPVLTKSKYGSAFDRLRNEIFGHSDNQLHVSDFTLFEFLGFSPAKVSQEELGTMNFGDNSPNEILETVKRRYQDILSQRSKFDIQNKIDNQRPYLHSRGQEIFDEVISLEIFSNHQDLSERWLDRMAWDRAICHDYGREFNDSITLLLLQYMAINIRTDFPIAKLVNRLSDGIIRSDRVSEVNRTAVEEIRKDLYRARDDLVDSDIARIATFGKPFRGSLYKTACFTKDSAETISNRIVTLKGAWKLVTQTLKNARKRNIPPINLKFPKIKYGDIYALSDDLSSFEHLSVKNLGH